MALVFIVLLFINNIHVNMCILAENISSVRMGSPVFFVVVALIPTFNV